MTQKLKVLSRRYWPFALVFAIAFGIYARTLAADFLRWDDRQNILLNVWIHQKIFSLIWTKPYYNMYIPVTYSLWTFLWHIAPDKPLQFHAFNVLFHAINTVLVYMVARVVLRPEERLAGIFAALVFACHPLQVETVAWISTGRDVLAGFFALLATYLVLRFEDRRLYALSFLLFSLACFSKPSVAVFPVAIGMVAYGVQLLTRDRLLTLATWMVPALGATIATKVIQQLDADLRLTPIGLVDRTLVAVDSLSFYIQKLFLPYPLAADYGHTPELALESDVWIYGLVALAVCAAAAFFWRKRIQPRYFYFTGLFVLMLAPVLGIIPFQAQAQTTVADRYAYYPLIGAGLLLGSLLARRSWTAGVMAAVLATWCAMTVMRAQVWSTNEGFFTDMLAKNERSHVALSSLGVEYILTNRLPQAEQVLLRAVQLRPKDVIPRTNLAQLYLMVNRPDKVLSDIEPLLNDPEFLRVNQTETRALASVYRLTARANWGMDLWTTANDFYCRWYRIDYENEEGKQEVQRFLTDARKHKAILSACEVSPTFSGSRSVNSQ